MFSFNDYSGVNGAVPQSACFGVETPFRRYLTVLAICFLEICVRRRHWLQCMSLLPVCVSRALSLLCTSLIERQSSGASSSQNT